MEAAHVRRHLQELRQRAAFLGALRPENQRYRLWLGDVVELVNAVWGLQSPQMAQIRQALQSGTVDRSRPASGTGTDRYLERLRRIDAILAACERELEGA